MEPGASTQRLWSEIYTDLVFRAPIVDYAARHADRGENAYVYEFAWPLAAPMGVTPHAADVPFAFGTVGHPHVAEKIGNAPEAERVAREMMAMWASFARSGDPGEEWPAFSADAPNVLTIGADRAAARTGRLLRYEQLRAWPALVGCAGSIRPSSSRATSARSLQPVNQ
jgi:para-nitrobenzyl esterase